PLGVGVLLERRSTIGQAARTNGTNHPVSTNAEVAVAQVDDLVGGQLELAVGVGEQHEIVAGSVTLGEVKLRHLPMLRAAAVPPLSGRQNTVQDAPTARSASAHRSAGSAPSLAS